MSLTTVELCAGGGGQALGLQRAGFQHLALVEIDKHACKTLRRNVTKTHVENADIKTWKSKPELRGCDLLAAGLPCPPFSQAGKQLGAADDRNLFPAFVGHMRRLQPKAFMIENVEGFMSKKFVAFRQDITRQLEGLGYAVQMRVFDAADFGIAQRRRRVVIVGLRHVYAKRFKRPVPPNTRKTVGAALHDLMAANTWDGALKWARKANRSGPTIVGGSRKHGGADLGPRGTRRGWLELGVEGKSLADKAPPPGFKGNPRLTLDMVKRLQGFPDRYLFSGGKTSSYRRIANAFPPVIAEAVGREIAKALEKGQRRMQQIEWPANPPLRRVKEPA